ncbi:MAG: triose-phosphate isomerase [Candidatus Nanohaloarchaea archaeon]
MLVINFKAYAGAMGEKARELAEKCSEAAERTGKEVVVAPQPPDILRMEDLELEVFSQHVDGTEPGSHTGHPLPESVSMAGASGTLLNHSERRLERKALKKSIDRAEEEGLTTLVCARSPEECGELGELGPDYVAFEPPELIGGEVSVSSARPGMIEEAVSRSKPPVLTGAGVKTREDVEKSIELGCEGVLVASGVVKAKDPQEKIVELAEGLR